MNLAQGSTTAQSLDRHMPAVSLWALAYMRFPDGSVVKKLPANAGDLGLIPELGRSRGEGNGNPLQYFCLENLMDRGAWRPTVRGVAKSQTRLSNFI